MEKPLRIRILEYLKEHDAVDAKIDIGFPFLEHDDSTEARQKLRTALDYLKEEKFIALSGVEPIRMLDKQAGQHPSKYHTGIKASITKLGEKEIEPPKEVLPVRVFITEDEKAIELFEKQKAKIHAFPNSDDEFWRNDTLGLVEKFIGRESSQYGLLSSHTFWPNLNAIPPETDEYQRDRGRKMIDSCITFIALHGIKKEPLHIPISTTNNYNNTVHDGNVYQDLSQDNSLSKQTTNIKTPNTISSNSIMEKWQLWVAIAVGIIALLTGLKTCGYL